MAITFTTHATANITGTVITVTLPAYTADDYIILFFARNNASTTFTFGSNVTTTELANTGGRLAAYRIVPNTLSETSFTVTSTNSVWTWLIGKAAGVDMTAPVASIATSVGSNATSSIYTPPTLLDYITTGNELAIALSGVNATATWTPTTNTKFNTTAGNAAMMLNAKNPGPGQLSVVYEDMDRGLNGTNRLESTLSIVLQAAPNGTPNVLVNGSFDDPTATAAGWETEGNTTGTPQYTKSTTGVTDGERAQNIQYNGQAGDTSKMFAIYQAPISASAGQTYTFSLDISGTKTNTVMLIGIEDFLTGGTYISESDTVVTTTTSTPTTYTVSHTCAADTDYIAVYVQFNEVVSSSVVNVNIDKAILTLDLPTGRTVKKLVGGVWVDLPVMILVDDVWVQANAIP